MKRIVLGYSGTLATTVAIPWLGDTQKAEVVAVTLDLGQVEELEAIRDRALAAGAVRAHVLDVRDVFARDYIAPAIRAGALQDAAMLAALAHPLIAKTLVEIAALEQAGIVAHGARGDDDRRLAAIVEALSPGTLVVAPASNWNMTRASQLEYAPLRGLLAETPFGEERAPAKTSAEPPDEPAYVDVRIDRGVPGAINHIDMPLADLLPTLGTIASAHGVAAPAAVILQGAHDELQRLTMPADVDRAARAVRSAYVDAIGSGGWFGPLRKALDAFLAAADEHVSGVVRMKLFKGDVESQARQEAPPAKPWPLVAIR
jgi:argininosuccinate synthase